MPALARVTSNATNLQDLKCFARFAKANGMEVKGAIYACTRRPCGARHRAAEAHGHRRARTGLRRAEGSRFESAGVTGGDDDERARDGERDEAQAMEHRSDGADEAADVMHMERRAALRPHRDCPARDYRGPHGTADGRGDRGARGLQAGRGCSCGSSTASRVSTSARLLVQVRGYARGRAMDGRWRSIERPCAWPEVSRG